MGITNGALQDLEEATVAVHVLCRLRDLSASIPESLGGSTMITFPRMHADERGETHIGVHELATHDASLGPPPNPVGRMTDPIKVSSLVTYSAPAGTGATWHSAPQPYI